MFGNPVAATLARAVACVAFFLIAAVSAQQQAAQPTKDAAPAAEHSDAGVWTAAQAAMVHGPQDVALADQAKLALPEGYGFVPKTEGAAVMKLMGNQTDEHFIGLIFPDTNAAWLATLDYEPVGYIEEGDATDWNVDRLLARLKDRTQKDNEERIQQGIAPIEVTKWVKAPAYDAQQHQLVWSTEIRRVGQSNQDPAISYNSYALGREGYLWLNLITSNSQLATDAASARQLLSSIQFNAGKRYGDFNKSADKRADYGLAALVGGSANQKAGFLSMAAKLMLIALAAIAGISAKKLMRSRRSA
jgi:uncharacterized membrane-anchored protein